MGLPYENATLIYRTFKHTGRINRVPKENRFNHAINDKQRGRAHAFIALIDSSLRVEQLAQSYRMESIHAHK